MTKTVSFVFAVFLSILVSFGLNYFSANICKTNPTFLEHYEYSYARANVSDYSISPYQGNEAFYNDVNISKNDLEFWKSYTIDKDYFNKDVLIAVGNYTSKSLYNNSRLRFAINKNLELAKASLKQNYRDLVKIKSKMHIPISNKAFLLVVLCLFVSICFVAIVLIRRAQKTRPRINIIYLLLVSFLISFWMLFFLIVRIDESNFLFIVVSALVVANIIINRFNDFWILALLSMCSVFLYLYQRCFRMFFRVSYTFLIPTIIFLFYLLFSSGRIKRLIGNSVVKSFVAFSLIVISILFSCNTFWYKHYIPSTKTYDVTLRTYINNHPDCEYVSIWIGSLVDPAYTNAVLTPTTLKNNTDFASWYKSSDYYDTIIHEKFSKPVLEEAINSNSIRFIIKNRNDSVVLEQFYNEHYSSYGDINLKQEDEIKVSGSLNDGTSLNVTAYVLKVQVK